jgi:hypothetical protein
MLFFLGKEYIMAEHENCIGESDEWYTPPEIIEAIGLEYDLDPCSPGEHHWIPAKKVFTKHDDGLNKIWHGLVFMNPPFGGRNGHVPWLKKFLDHGNGIAIVRAYTSAGWFHDNIPKADAILFPKGKTKFIKPDGTIGKSPGHGIILVAMGKVAVQALKKSNIGIYFEIIKEAQDAAG